MGTSLSLIGHNILLVVVFFTQWVVSIGVLGGVVKAHLQFNVFVGAGIYDASAVKRSDLHHELSGEYHFIVWLLLASC
jgi:hypothetical protein